MRLLNPIFKKTSWIFIPILVIIFAILFKTSIGPYWLGVNNDPAYYFVFNFFYLLDGVPLVFTDHPGTPVDVIGALVLQLTNLGKVHEELFTATILRPEFYLNIVSIILIVLYVGSLIFLGWYAYRRFKDPFFAFCVQSSALLLLAVRSYPSDTALPIIANVISDAMLMTVVNLLMIALMALFLNTSKEQGRRTALGLGVICALGVATKLTFFPLVPVVLVLVAGVFNRLYFLLAFFLSAAVFLIPIYSQSEKFFSWIDKLILYKGVHGSGGHGLIDWPSFILNLKHIISLNIFLFMGVCTASIIAGFHWSRGKAKIDSFILVICSAIAVQFLLVAKQFAPHYMTPSIGIFGLVLGFLYLKFKARFSTVVWFVMAVIFVVVNVVSLVVYQQKLKAKNTAVYQMASTIQERYPGFAICSYYRGSSPLYAMAWTHYAPDQYAMILKKLYPDFYYYDIWYHDFMDFTRRIVPLSEISDKFKGVILYGSAQSTEYFLPTTTVQRLLGTPEGEYLDGVIQHISGRAGYYYQLSAQFARAGDFKMAFNLAIYAKKLGLSDDIGPYMQWLLGEIMPRKGKP